MENAGHSHVTDFKSERTDLAKETKSSNNSYNKNNSFESKVCLFFKKNRYCSYGQNCRFLHDKQSSKQTDQNPMVTFKTKVFVRRDEENTNNSKSHWKERYKATSSQVPANKRRICRYFKAGNCDKGELCPFQHISDDTRPNNIVTDKTNKKKRVPICHYFKKGACDRGENCKFYHQTKLENIKQKIHDTSEKLTECDPDENIQESDIEQMLETNKKEDLSTNSYDLSEENRFKADLDTSANKISQIPRVIDVPRNKMLYNFTSLSVEELNNLRDTEIAQLKKRYPKHTVAEEKQSISFIFEPSDPDWPFDLKTLELEVFFPEKYPIEVCSITVLRPSSNIPEILIRYLNRTIIDWVNERHQDLLMSDQVELMFRPFLRWFDKNLENLFIAGLRKVKLDLDAQKDGIEFVPVENLFQSKLQSDISNGTVENESATAVTSKEVFSEAKEEIKMCPPVTPSKNNSSLDTTALKQGVKVLFTGLEFVEGVAALSCTKLAITVHCIRCKTPSNMKCIPGKNNTSKCTKCSKIIECNFVPSIIHQFSNLAGNLYLIECQVMDINLVESTFLIDCLNCSKQVSMDGLHYGQKQKRWCMFCNEKLIFSIGSVKFQATSSTYIAAKNMSVKKSEKRKDPLIKEGEPLPEFGACKHYKKSHRWLRFPCCGRIYPCDVCHDEKENDHEMKFASRMICGLCSKEQPYSKEKPCISCSGSLTAKSGTHWEGGKGCRNKIKMARDDKHKYVGTSKTVSRKAQNVKTGKKN